MKKLLRLLAIAALGMGLSTGTVSAASIDTTGPNSTTTITAPETTVETTTNLNTAVITNTNVQTVASGAAVTQFNTRGGNAGTGNAGNSSSFAAEIGINNGSHQPQQPLGGSWSIPGSGHSISNTGPSSTTTITAPVTTTVVRTNTNTITIANTNTQTAASGAATVQNNTEAGNAQSGTAANESSTSIGVQIGN